MSKIGRNQPCPCGSGAKYKRCHGRLLNVAPAELAGFGNLLERVKARQRVRETQQGLGRPIVSAAHRGNRLVGVGKTVYWSKEWRAFPDFLLYYIKRKFGSDWGEAELRKPLAERHPLMQWYDALCAYQKKVGVTPEKVSAHPIVGSVACYLGVAYGLYLLEHNVELQSRFIARLKDVAQFQGAYYELLVASTLIRAGFELTLEDEADRSTKHCEFAAVSKGTGKRYWVEAKMRSVAGLLGKTKYDGGADTKPLRQMVPHLNKAFAKPAPDERLIFIDLNAPPAAHDGKPDWLDAAVTRLETYEARELKAGDTAYVFLTNLSFHRDLDTDPAIAAAPFGLGIGDFNRPGWVRLGEAYRQKLKHADAHAIMDALGKILWMPATFDGALPSEAFGHESQRVVIGETYTFKNNAGVETKGTVTNAICSVEAKVAVVTLRLPNGSEVIGEVPMTDVDIEEYRTHPEAYFGRVVMPVEPARTEFEFFERLMAANERTPRPKMLEWLGADADRPEIAGLSDQDLRILYCERMVAAVKDIAGPMRE